MAVSGPVPVYTIVKDFAGPLATVFAATIAAVVTFHFNRRQTTISAAQRDVAASQRDIANDKLKVDLFKERYSVYLTAKQLIECVTPLKDHEDVSRHSMKIRTLYGTLDESRFFFDAHVCRFLSKLHDDTEAFLMELSADVSTDDPAAWSARAERLAKRQGVLRQTYADLPEMFEASLGFAQLTGRSKTD